MGDGAIEVKVVLAGERNNSLTVPIIHTGHSNYIGQQARCDD